MSDTPRRGPWMAPKGLVFDLPASAGTPISERQVAAIRSLRVDAQNWTDQQASLVLAARDLVDDFIHHGRMPPGHFKEVRLRLILAFLANLAFHHEVRDWAWTTRNEDLGQEAVPAGPMRSHIEQVFAAA